MDTLENTAPLDPVADGKGGAPPKAGGGTRGLSDLDTVAALFNLLRSVAIHDRHMRRRWGITPQQYEAILEIHFCTGPEPITIGGLAQRLNIKHNSVVSVVHKLCHRGLVARLPSQRDGRVMHLQLTADGQAMLQAVALADLDQAGSAAANLVA